MTRDGNVPKALCFERRLGRTTPPPGLNIGGNRKQFERRNDVLPSLHNYFILYSSHGFPNDFLPLVWGFRLPTEPVDDLRCLTQVVHPLLSFDPVRIEAVDTSGSVEIQGVDGLIPLKGAQGSLSKKMRYSSYEIHLRIFNILPGIDGVLLLRGCMSKTENKGMSVMN